MLFKASEYDQETPQLQTADKPMALSGRATQQSQDIQSKATSSLFPIKMIAKLERTQSIDCITKHRKNTEPHNGTNNHQCINNLRTNVLESTAALKQLGDLNAFNWYQIFALASVVVKAQKNS